MSIDSYPIPPSFDRPLMDPTMTGELTYPQIERRKSIALAAGGLALPFPDRRGAMIDDAGEMSTEALAAEARSEVTAAVNLYRDRIEATPTVEPTQEKRATSIAYRETDSPMTTSGWRPGKTYVYESDDPYSRLNPDHVDAVADLIGVATKYIQRLRYTHEPTLTYIKNDRGKNPTEMTQMIKAIDPGVASWIGMLPAAPGLRPVAKPWEDEPIIVKPKGQKEIVELPTSRHLRAFVGGGLDGRAVREREAWESSMVTDIIHKDGITEEPLVMTSLGTGTGEPGMDAVLAAMDSLDDGKEHSLVVNGFDISPTSLKIAQYVADRKGRGDKLTFNARFGNILSEDGIKEAVGNTNGKIYEAIGFTEYVPSDDAPTEMEQKARADMVAMGLMSAQEFYKCIYDNMPSGSVFLTGNMRNDSPQGEFITDGLGWPGIIRRSTEDYMRILEESGVPSEAITLYLPDPDESAATYNLVAIRKP